MWITVMKMKHFSLKYVSISFQLLNFAISWCEQNAICKTEAVFSFISQWMNLDDSKSHGNIVGGELATGLKTFMWLV